MKIKNKNVPAASKLNLLRKICNFIPPDLIIIDDMGLKSLPKHSAEYLLEVIHAPLRKPLNHHDQQSTH